MAIVRFCSQFTEPVVEKVNEYSADWEITTVDTYAF